MKDSLEKDQKELESKQAEYEKQGDNLNNLITSKSAEVANLDSEIQAAAEAAAKEAAERAAKEAAEKAGFTNVCVAAEATVDAIVSVIEEQ